MSNNFYIYLFYYFTLSSLLRFVVVLLSSTQHPKQLGEKRVRRIVNYGSLLDILHFGGALIFLRQNVHLIVPDFMFFGIDFEVNWTDLSLIFLGFSIIIIALINRFSIIYLHRDPYYYKFFSIIFILQMALCLLILTNGSESVFIGWELLGLSSVLLIAFFEYRASVLKNSLIILGVYKISDVILYSVLIYSAAKGITQYNAITNPLLIGGLLLACLIKSSVFPWFWLPRAMEGPTPLTAIFYGGLATHIPVFIFMNVWGNQDLYSMPLLMSVMSLLIGSSILCSSLLSRCMNDAKNSIAYAAITQVGIIYLEVLFGFFYLAVAHCLIHGIYRTIEFLKAPSLLYTRHTIEQGRKSINLTPRGFKGLLPKPLRIWIYQICYHEFIAPRVLMNRVENFMGLSSSKMGLKDLKSYIIYSLSALALVKALTIYGFHQKISLQSEFLSAIGYALNILALINKYNPKLFFFALITSVFVTISILAERLFPPLIFSSGIYLLILAYITFKSYTEKSLSQNTVNFMGRISTSPHFNLFILILGLSLIGMPGLGTFFIWERLEHHLLSEDPGLIINAYMLLVFNTIVFFRFYYANYLGKHDLLRQFHAAYQY